MGSVAQPDKFTPLKEKLTEGKLLLPGDEGFEDSLKRWSSTCIKPAAAVAQPKTVEEVAEVVKFAAATKTAFNVKGGGHSTSQASSAPSPEGMILDLAQMRNVSVDPEARTVSFQGGCLWRDVDDALWEHKLATPGGTVSHTGVGGLILHGGFGLLTGIHGLTVDCLLSCEVVLADGSIVTASADENPHLFWALRGAGSSYGVVTQFTSKAFPQGDIWAGVIVVSKDKLPTVVDFINKWSATTDGSSAMIIAFGYLPPNPDAPEAPRLPSITLQVAYLGEDPVVKGEELFAPFLELEHFFKQVGPMPYAAVNKLADEQQFPAGCRYQFGGANFTTPLSLSTAEEIGEKFWGFVAENPGKGLEGSVWMLECIATGAALKVPADATSFASRGEYYNVGLVYTWDSPELDSTIRLKNREFQTAIRKLGYFNDAGEKKDGGVGYYINYLSSDTVPAEAAFGSNAERLRALKKKYDPTNTFDKLWKLVGKVEDESWRGA